jgi:hypothetical protein
MPVIRASEAGAALDSDLMHGGGTDDTAVLQGLLDQARDGAPLHLVIDGPALVSGLAVWSNTTIEFPRGAGLYLRDGSYAAVLRNANGSKGERIDEQITILGGFFNGNKDGQRYEWVSPDGIVDDYGWGGPGGPINRMADGGFQRTLQFFGVRHLTIEGSTVWNTRSFAIWISNADYVTVRDVRVDVNYPPYPGEASHTEQFEFITGGGENPGGSNQDGLHFTGPTSNVLVERVWLRTFDDGIAFIEGSEPDATYRTTYSPEVGEGGFTDIVIRDVHFDDGYVGIRMTSCNYRYDRILFENLTGTMHHRMVVMGPQSNPEHFGDFGTVTFRNLAIDPRPSAPMAEMWTRQWDESSAADADPDSEADGGDEGYRPLFSLNGRIERLVIDGATTSVIDDRPLFRVGPTADIGLLSATMVVRDPSGRPANIRIHPTSRIRQLDLSIEVQSR